MMEGKKTVSEKELAVMNERLSDLVEGQQIRSVRLVRQNDLIIELSNGDRVHIDADDKLNISVV